MGSSPGDIQGWNGPENQKWLTGEMTERERERLQGNMKDMLVPSQLGNTTAHFCSYDFVSVCRSIYDKVSAIIHFKQI